MLSIMSIDVEDWFHILDVPSAPDRSLWDSLPSHVEKNFMKLLDLLSLKGVQATCFFLGYIGNRFPGLVTEAVSRGHEVASHGYDHRLVYQMSAEEFCADAVRSKKLLEDISGMPVKGYRSAGFSVTAETAWFFDKLMEAGYCYDSSVFPARRGHGGLETNKYQPYVIKTDSGRILEFPITLSDMLGMKMCFFGGGYLRLFPYPLVKHMGRKVLQEGRPVIFYVHPREIAPDHPRLSMGFKRRFKSYVNLQTMEGKIKKILRDFEVTSFEKFITENPWLLTAD